MRIIILTALLVTTNLLMAQGSLQFEKDTHSFGEIQEEGGYAEYTFEFTNTGEEPIKITNVKASCGCTTPGWTTEEVMPGENGFIKARYNPRNRPGKFRKSLRVSTTQKSSDVVLYIAGYVKPKGKTPMEEYPISTGSLRLKYRSLNMSRITTEKKVEKEFEIYNAGNDSLELEYGIMEVPSHITLIMDPPKLVPAQKGILRVSYDPMLKNDLGFVSDNVTIHVDTTLTIRNEFYVLATIEEYFPEMSAEELDAAAKLEISERVFDFGKVKEGSSVVAEFELKNAGKKKLNFRKIKSNCSCVTYEVKSQNMKKGKTQTLKLTFDTTGRRGNQYKTVTIFSNDPSDPTQMVTIKGTVEKNLDSN